MLSKGEIRRQIRERLDSVDPEVRRTFTTKIQARVLDMPMVYGFDPWFVYVSNRSEVPTHDLIRELLARGETVTVPLIIGEDKMIARPIESFDELRFGDFGILAPPQGEAYPKHIEYCVCPGVAFTAKGERIGTGRGYYDRYLASNPPMVTIGLAFECQIVAELPQETHDRRMHLIVTENRVIHCQ